MLKPEADEDVVQECWFGDFSPWIRIVKWFNVQRGRRYCSSGVSPNVSATKLRSVSLKCREHHVLHRKCLSREMPHTHATEDTSSVNPSLELTS